MSALEEDVKAVCTPTPPSLMGPSLICICSFQSQEIGPDLQSTLVEPDHVFQERSHELNEIAKSIASLAELFKDLSSLVIDQGTILDSVEYNVEQSAINMEEAVKELNIATRCCPSRLSNRTADSQMSRYQKNTGRRKCIFLLMLIILGLILVLIFKPRRHVELPASLPTPALSPVPTAAVLELRKSTLARKQQSRRGRVRRDVGKEPRGVRWEEGWLA